MWRGQLTFARVCAHVLGNMTTAFSLGSYLLTPPAGEVTQVRWISHGRTGCQLLCMWIAHVLRDRSRFGCGRAPQVVFEEGYLPALTCPLDPVCVVSKHALRISSRARRGAQGKVVPLCRSGAPCSFQALDQVRASLCSGPPPSSPRG